MGAELTISPILPSTGFFDDTALARIQEPLMRFGQNLRRLREAKGWSQKQLAARLGQQSGNSTVSDWERRAVPPREETVKRLAKVLSTTVDELLAGVPSREAGVTSPVTRRQKIAGEDSRDMVQTMRRLEHLLALMSPAGRQEVLRAAKRVFDDEWASATSEVTESPSKESVQARRSSA